MYNTCIYIYTYILAYVSYRSDTFLHHGHPTTPTCLEINFLNLFRNLNLPCLVSTEWKLFSQHINKVTIFVPKSLDVRSHQTKFKRIKKIVLFAPS